MHGETVKLVTLFFVCQSLSQQVSCTVRIDISPPSTSYMHISMVTTHRCSSSSASVHAAMQPLLVAPVQTARTVRRGTQVSCGRPHLCSHRITPRDQASSHLRSATVPLAPAQLRDSVTRGPLAACGL